MPFKKLKYFFGLLLLAGLLFWPPRAEALDLQSELAYRVAYGGPADVELLLGKGADPNGINEIGWPLVTVAAGRADTLAVPLLEILLKAGADVNRGGPSRQYPVIIAARNGNVEVIQFLLDKHVDLGVRDNNGARALQVAQENGNDEVAALLEELDKKYADEEAARHSPERQGVLLRDLAFESCATQYLGYYFKSGQDKFPQAHIDQTLSAHKQKLSAITSDLYGIFHVSSERMTDIRSQAAQQIYDQMEELISNRNRRKHGIGKDSDLKERCGKIADGLTAPAPAEENNKKK